MEEGGRQAPRIAMAGYGTLRWDNPIREPETWKKKP